MTTNREIAEALGWRVVPVTPELRTSCYYLTDDASLVLLDPDGEVRQQTFFQDEEAFWLTFWQKDYVEEDTVLPDWTHNPAEALGLLDGVRWSAAKHNDYGDGEYIEFNVSWGGHSAWAEIKIVDGDEAAAFAQAACDAWIAWRKGAG